MNREIGLGIIIVAIAGISLFWTSFPVIWIGGFIWGIALIIRGSKTLDSQNISTNTRTVAVLKNDPEEERQNKIIAFVLVGGLVSVVVGILIIVAVSH